MSKTEFNEFVPAETKIIDTTMIDTATHSMDDTVHLQEQLTRSEDQIKLVDTTDSRMNDTQFQEQRAHTEARILNALRRTSAPNISESEKKHRDKINFLKKQLEKLPKPRIIEEIPTLLSMVDPETWASLQQPYPSSPPKFIGSIKSYADRYHSFNASTLPDTTITYIDTLEKAIRYELSNSMASVQNFLDTIKRMEIQVALIINEATSALRQNSQWRLNAIRDTEWWRDISTNRMIDTVLHFVYLRGAECFRSMAATHDACNKLLPKNDTNLQFMKLEINLQLQKLWFPLNLKRPIKPLHNRRHN